MDPIALYMGYLPVPTELTSTSLTKSPSTTSTSKLEMHFLESSDQKLKLTISYEDIKVVHALALLWMNELNPPVSQENGWEKLEEFVDSEKAETFQIEVWTGHVKFAGTTANVWIQLRGSKRTTGRLPLSEEHCTSLPESGTAIFQIGSVAKFRFRLAAIGEVRSLRIGHDGLDFASGWYVESIKVFKKGVCVVFTLERWLDSNKSKEDTTAECEVVGVKQNELQPASAPKPKDATACAAVQTVIDVRIPGIEIEVHDDCQGWASPLFRLGLESVKAQGIMGNDSSISAHVELLAETHNARLKEWEPMIEPWAFDAIYEQQDAETHIEIRSDFVLDINILQESVIQTGHALALWAEDWKAYTEASKLGEAGSSTDGGSYRGTQNAFQVHNKSGCPLEFWFLEQEKEDSDGQHMVLLDGARSEYMRAQYASRKRRSQSHGHASDHPSTPHEGLARDEHECPLVVKFSDSSSKFEKMVRGIEMDQLGRFTYVVLGDSIGKVDTFNADGLKLVIDIHVQGPLRIVSIYSPWKMKNETGMDLDVHVTCNEDSGLNWTGLVQSGSAVNLPFWLASTDIAVRCKPAGKGESNWSAMQPLVSTNEGQSLLQTLTCTFKVRPSETSAFFC